MQSKSHVAKNTNKAALDILGSLGQPSETWATSLTSLPKNSYFDNYRKTAILIATF